MNYAFLYRLLELNLQASVLILGILLLRRLARGRISPRLQYGLWGLAALRLLIPFSVRSKFSLFNHMNFAGGSGGVAAPTPALGQAAPMLLVPVQEMAPAPSPLPEALQAGAAQHAFERVDSHAAVQGWAPDVATLLLLGALIFLGYAAIINWKFYKSQIRPAQRLDIACALPVYGLQSAASPCLFGVVRPGILLNGAAMEPPRRQALALAHELAHYRRRDHWAAALRVLLCAMYWYNPLVWVAARCSRQDCELACDSAVMREFSQEECEEYGLALLSLIPGGRANGLACATAMADGKRTLKQRIAFIGKRPRTVAVAAILLAVCMLALCLFACTGALLQGEQGSGMSVNVVETGVDLPVQEVQRLDTNSADALAVAFGDYLQETPYDKLQLVSLESTIQITDTVAKKLSGAYPDVYLEIRDYIVDKSGRVKFRASEEHWGVNRSIAVHAGQDESSYTFVLEPNMTALFSSFSGDYEPGATLRGFAITLRYREPEKAEDTIRGYVFMLRSDAHAFKGEMEDTAAPIGGADGPERVYVSGSFPYDIMLGPGQSFSSADMGAVVERMRTDSYDQEKFDERIAAGKRVKIYSHAPFEGGTLVVAGLPTEGEFLPDLFYVKDGEVKNRTYGAGYWAINYARFMGHTIVFGPSFAWDEDAPLETTHAAATFFDGQEAVCDMLSTPARSAGYLLVVPGNTWLKTLRLYNGDTLVEHEKSSRFSSTGEGWVNYMAIDSTLEIRNYTNLCSMYASAAMRSSQYDPDNAKQYLEADGGERVPLQYWPKNEGLLVQDIWRSANNINEVQTLIWKQRYELRGLEPVDILSIYFLRPEADTGGVLDWGELAEPLRMRGDESSTELLLPHELSGSVYMLVIETDDGYYSMRARLLK